jgi:hypothetical protein
MKRASVLALLVLSAFAGLLAAPVRPWSAGGYVRTEDRNGDGRPDVWRAYDRDGHVTRIAFDVNFDGRSDVQEQYRHGVLVRRDSDRNFDGRVDLEDEFDDVTGEQVRSVADADFDGTGDLLVLFRDGQSVFWRWADRGAGAALPLQSDAVQGAADGPLAPLTDPFQHDRAVSPVHTALTTGACVSGSKCLPTARDDLLTDLALSFAPVSYRSRVVPAADLPCPPRAPPPLVRS